MVLSTDAPDQGAGPSTGLSLREKMRLQAQQRLHDRASTAAASSTSVSTHSHATSLGPIDADSDDEALGSLTLGRSKRQAALKRPATYSIDPLDDATRLRRDPNKLLSSPAKHASSPVTKTKNIETMIREQQRRIKRGTDAAGFSRAEAIAQSMEQERLGKMGIASSAQDDGADDKHGPRDKPSQAKASNGDSSRHVHGPAAREPELTVQALSPTIPSFLWSSQSEGGLTEDELDLDAGATKQEQQLAASLAAVGADEEQRRQALDILQRDIRDRPADVSSQASQGHISFYRPGRVLVPKIDAFCPLPSLSAATQGEPPSTAAAASSSPTSSNLDWTTIAPHLLLAGCLPPSLELDKRQIRRILVWTGISFVLERNVYQSHLLSAFFRSLVSNSAASPYRPQLESAIPKALTDLVRRIPRILYLIGMHEDVFEECFPDDASVSNAACFTVARRKASSQPHSSSRSAEFRDFRVYVTQAERDDLVANLAKLVEMVASASHAGFVDDHLSVLAGYVTSMAIACAASTNFALQSQVESAFSAIIRAAREQSGTVVKLQQEVCRRTFTALGMDSIAVRARLVTIFPGEGKELGAVKRFLAWCVLTEHLAQRHTVTTSPSPKRGTDAVPSSDSTADAGEDVAQIAEEAAHWRRTPFEPVSLDLEMLARAVDAGDARSPFYIVPLNTDASMARDDGSSTASALETRSTSDFERLIAATQLLALVLRELPIHLCTFSPPTATTSADRSTPTPEHPEGQPLPPPASTEVSAKWPRALRLALRPYLHLHPSLDETRIAAVRSIVAKLAHANSRIRDNRGDVILRSLAKDALQRLGHSLEYQLQMYLPNASIAGASFIR